MEELREFWRRFRRNTTAMIGLLIVVFLAIIALTAPLTAPWDAVKSQNLMVALQPPSLDHPFGTDHLGRDMLTRILYGSQISLLVGFLVTAMGMVLGTLLGLLAGYLGGWWDRSISRFTDIMLAFPFLLLAIAVSATLGEGLLNELERLGIPTFSTLPVVLALGIASFPSYTRLVRGCVLSIKEEQFIDAARALGAGKRRIMLRHILPNLGGTLLVFGTLRISTAILAESGLSYLGLGAKPPEPTWGNMLSDGREYILFYPWIPLFPGLAILVTVLGFNFLGDGLRDLLDPHMKDS